MYSLGSRSALTVEGDSLFSLMSGELKPYPPIPSNVWKGVNPQVWDCDVPGRALTAQPVKVILKDPTNIPHKKQCPLKPEAKSGLQPLIDKFLRHGILKPCQSPYNTPILSVKMPNGDYQVVQGLRAINEAVMPVHPIVPNLYPILTKVPGDTNWFTLLDIKDAFFAFH